MFTTIVHISALRELVLSYFKSDRVGNDVETCTGDMHRALEIPEILCLVFNMNLSDSDPVNCARVCRLWGIWALDLFWRTRPVPLIYLLRILSPGIVKKIGSYNDGAYAYWEIAKIDQGGWRRFMTISSKIITVILSVGVGETTVERIKRATQSFNGLREPFSHLRTLRIKCNPRDHQMFNNAISFVTVQSLTRVLVEYPNSHQGSMEWLCGGVPASAPNVTHLELS